MLSRLINVVIVGLCYLYFLRRGDAKGIDNKARIFAIINGTKNIGDAICTTPVARAIKKAHPESKVIFVGSPKNQLTLEGNKDIDQYIIYHQHPYEIIKQLRKEKVDAGVAINFSVLDIGMLFLSGAKAISCFVFSSHDHKLAPRPYRLLSRLMHTVEYTPGVYVPGQYLKLLLPFRIISQDISKHLSFTSKAKEAVRQALAKRGIKEGSKLVAIAPGAGTKIKQWPAERFAAVASHISKEHNCSILLIGGPADEMEIKAMESVLEDSVTYCNFGGQSLDELKATLSMVKLIIGNDSGSIYVAESFGAATLVLVGPTDEAEHPLQDERHKVVVAEKREGPLLQSYTSDESEVDHKVARSQMESITVEQVCRATDSLLSSL